MREPMSDAGDSSEGKKIVRVEETFSDESMAEELERVNAISAAAFEELGQDPEKAQLLEEVMERYLGDPPERRTWDLLQEATRPLLGEEGLAALAAGSGGAMESMFETLDLSDEAQRVVTRVLSLFGPRIVQARYRSPTFGRAGEDWRHRRASVDQNLTTGEIFIDLALEKYDGTEFALRSEADSFVRLIAGLCEVVLAPSIVETVSEETAARASAVLKELVEALPGESKDQTGDDD